MSDLTKTLLLTIALPDFWAEDIPDDAAELWDGDMMEAVYSSAGLISDTARIFIMHGDECGNDLHLLRAVIVSADVVDRVPEHDVEEDERLTGAIAGGKWF
ncbi:MAG: hypothetical protein ABFE13_11950 [Phycisphaerales bacterium]